MPARKGDAKAKTTTRRRRGPAAPRGPEPREAPLEAGDPALAPLVERVRTAGGSALGAYRDPFAGEPLLVAMLPIKSVDPTPFQRDVSRTHADRLAAAIGASGAYLDPIIAVPGDGGFWTPNGGHRLVAARQLGQRAITALVIPDAKLAYRILALNVEKAHNLRDRSLEVIRMARTLAKEQPRSKEKDHELTFESPVYLTLGTVYGQRGRFSGSAYQPMLRRVDRFLDTALPAALRQRDQWGVRLMDIDDRVAAHVKALQERGFKSPYLKTLVVARCNPVRWVKLSRKKDAPPPMSMAEALTRTAANVRKFDPASVRAQDLALVAAVTTEEAE